MRKIFVTMAAMIMALIMSVTAFGCNLVVVNSEKDMAQVVAVVKIEEGVPEEGNTIYKRDMVLAYLNYGYYYEQNGYTRQQVMQSDKHYNTLAVRPKSISDDQTGMGVIYSRAKQVRDYFLDKTYRRESGRSMFYEVSTNVLEEVESQLGELNGEAFQTTLTDLWTAVQELSKDPSSSVTQGLFVQRASEFVERATAVYDGLSNYLQDIGLFQNHQHNNGQKYGMNCLDY